MIELKELVKNAVHFGHKASYWSPKMAVFIWGKKNNVHLIDVSKTAVQLEKAAKFLRSIAAQNKQIMWVGTKKAARDTIERIATELDQPYVTHRWIGGTLTNYSQVKKSVTKLLHYEDILSKSANVPYTKKELNKLQKLVGRLRANIGGIVNFKTPLGALVVVDINKEQAAVREAAVIGVPIIALVDTNSDPTLIDYVIPANDDAPKSIKLLMEYLAESVALGKEDAQKLAQEQQKEKEKVKVEKAKAASEKKEKVVAKDTVKAEPKKSPKVASKTKEPKKEEAQAATAKK